MLFLQPRRLYHRFAVCILINLTLNLSVSICAFAGEDTNKHSSELPFSDTPAKNTTPQKGFFDGYTLMPSLMGKNIVFEYRELGYKYADIGTATGRLIDEAYIAPGIELRSPISYQYGGIRGFNIDTFVETTYSTFAANKQRIYKDSKVTTEDLGTEVHGSYLDISYILFAQYRDTYYITDKIHAVRLGIGAGLRYFKAKGNIILTDNVLKRQEVAINVEETVFLATVMFEYQYGNFLLSAIGREHGFPFEYLIYFYREKIIEASYIFEF